MTIRFTCAQCGSVLKIKDELAGTDGHCPKCKTEFVVPAASSDEPHDKSGILAAKSAESAAKPSRSAKPSGKQRKGSSADEPFDPADFLMGE